MKITVFSDSHGNHEKLKIDKCDVLICCGDVCKKTGIYTEEEIYLFLIWFVQQDAKYKIFSPGNHDFCLDTSFKEIFKEQFPSIIYLEDSSIIIDNIKFYATPWVPRYGPFVFMKTEFALFDIFEKIEEDTDVLITHGPSFGILDITKNSIHVGSNSLSSRLAKLKKIKAHVFGHIHESNGVQEIKSYTNEYIAINAAERVFSFELKK